MEISRSIYIPLLLVSTIISPTYFLFAKQRIRKKVTPQQSPRSDNFTQVVDNNTNQGVYVGSDLKLNEINNTHIANETTKTINSNDEQNGNAYTIELVVAVDRVVQNKYGNRTKEYVETIMSKTSDLYSKSNLNDSVILNVVKIIYMKNELGSSETKVEGVDATDLLSNFCEFMEKSDIIHDAAVLITGHDIFHYKSYMPKDIIGLSYIGKMCTQLSCALVEDTGLNLTPVTIAHELGHSLSCFHDEDSECSKFPKSDWKSIMSSQLYASPKVQFWSKCSRNSIGTFLRTEQANCLLQSDQKKSNLVV